MKHTTTELIREPHPSTTHRYQVYRQSPHGGHHSHGPTLEAPDHAVALFVATLPMFDGGGVRLWDQREQRVVASAKWYVEKTRMGFSVSRRLNVFHDESLERVALQIAERERIEQSVASNLRMGT